MVISILTYEYLVIIFRIDFLIINKQANAHLTASLNFFLEQNYVRLILEKICTKVTQYLLTFVIVYEDWRKTSHIS